MLEKWLFGISSAIAEEAGNAAGTVADAAGTVADGVQEVSAAASIVSLIVPLLLMGLVFYFMLIRPQRKKDKKVKEMLDALKQGDRVTTIGGIYGTIVNIKDDTITLAIGSQRTEMVVARWAIRQVEAVSVENDGEVLA